MPRLLTMSPALLLFRLLPDGFCSADLRTT